MARITVEDCIDKFKSRFELVLVASNRARKLHSGDNPTVEKDNDKNTVIALREIAGETIPIDDMKNSLIEEYQTVSSQNEEDSSLEYSDLEDSNNNDEESNKEDILLKEEPKIETLEEKPEFHSEITNEEEDGVLDQKDNIAIENSEEEIN
tara:strand:+ start:20 stop:472 length:453 start_codon:yes stop_codon:yes gene_type:complete